MTLSIAAVSFSELYVYNLHIIYSSISYGQSINLTVTSVLAVLFNKYFYRKLTAVYHTEGASPLAFLGFKVESLDQHLYLSLKYHNMLSFFIWEMRMLSVLVSLYSIIRQCMFYRLPVLPSV